MSNNKKITKNLVSEQDYLVVAEMSRTGGSFVKALAETFYKADHNNFRRLKNAFPDYWDIYESIIDDRAKGLQRLSDMI